MRKRPNFLIIGAQKGGSTWLYDMLKQHKEIFLPSKVEVHHFNRVKCHTDELIEEYRATCKITPIKVADFPA